MGNLNTLHGHHGKVLALEREMSTNPGPHNSIPVIFQTFINYISAL